MNFSSLKSIDTKNSYPFALSLGVSLFTAIASSLISVFIAETNAVPNECININTFCISFFSTITTFCLTTIIQNSYEFFYSVGNSNENKHIGKNILSLLALFAYMFLYIIYLLNVSVLFGIIFLFLSFGVLVTSVLAFVETFCDRINENKGSVSG